MEPGDDPRFISAYDSVEVAMDRAVDRVLAKRPSDPNIEVPDAELFGSKKVSPRTALLLASGGWVRAAGAMDRGRSRSARLMFALVGCDLDDLFSTTRSRRRSGCRPTPRRRTG